MRDTPGGLHRLRLLPAVLILAVASCASDDPWTFALSRSFYGQPHPPYDFSGFADSGEGAGEAAAVLIVFPFVLDVIALPVTLTRDLIVLD
ncbi:MAG: hypothetical protein V3T22_11430 [Planctomycetota bacterium]